MTRGHSFAVMQLLEAADRLLIPLGFCKIVQETMTAYNYTISVPYVLDIADQHEKMPIITHEDNRLFAEHGVSVNSTAFNGFHIDLDITNEHSLQLDFHVCIQHNATVNFGIIWHSFMSPNVQEDGSEYGKLTQEMREFQFNTLYLYNHIMPTVQYIQSIANAFPTIIHTINDLYTRYIPYKKTELIQSYKKMKQDFEQAKKSHDTIRYLAACLRSRPACK